ncbi:hypothetical protein DUK53_14945 [Listeria sp. SHR_NRA_18]|uniref:hypothetical protein n=1 Tax=Listeria sp. SHR_NRA_18 TaxID=2269046 RepID=UPI000F5EE413|nr:hypothetical protein [Listeria sp. SHR_NRA_18]RQW65686.1 hypothetical protein DUK53_14945 [Listeria sp. SHR_NRA_18]
MFDLGKAKETLVELETMNQNPSPFFKRIEMDMSEAIELWETVIKLLETNKKLELQIYNLENALRIKQMSMVGVSSKEAHLVLKVHSLELENHELKSKIKKLEARE